MVTIRSTFIRLTFEPDYLSLLTKRVNKTNNQKIFFKTLVYKVYNISSIENKN